MNYQDMEPPVVDAVVGPKGGWMLRITVLDPNGMGHYTLRMDSTTAERFLLNVANAVDGIKRSQAVKR